MRTLLRQRATGLFFRAVGAWTAQADEAFNFKSTERLIRFLRTSKLVPSELELIVRFDDPRFDINLPLDDRFFLPVPQHGSHRPGPSVISG